ncbi:MAG: beta-L-arabinofuranosidase domain-containing protein, partial [Fimbriimonas sp.]
MPFMSLACLLVAIAPMSDVLTLAEPGQVTLGGYLGKRVTNNAKGRLLAVKEDELLDGFRHRPGSHPWIGEHVGKFLDAATRAWAYTGDTALKAKIDRVAKGLMATQEPDGYLGTYESGKRFGLYQGADWDVWSHKYDLLGLLTYYRYTKDPQALGTCRRIGDLLINTFGPGKKTLISAGTHMGMAATSILEPIVLLHRATGDPRYLDFARQIVAEYDLAGGPGIVKSLSQTGKVAGTANGKAYEMLSNLVGLCELGRETGDKQYQKVAEAAWKDVVATQLYITGTASHGEHFGKDFDLPNGVNASLGETCVTVTWIQLNAQLLRLTGDRKYADEIERSAYNHLSASQREDGNQWCYYTPLEGVKPFGDSINCCLSSGPRGMALMPELAFQTSPGALWVSTIESGTYRAPGFEVQVSSPFPLVGLTRVSVIATKP